MENTSGMSLPEMIVELEAKGWAFSEAHIGDDVYPFFTIGELKEWAYVPLFKFYYTDRMDQPEWRLKRGMSSMDIDSWPDPVSVGDIQQMLRHCSNHA